MKILFAADISFDNFKENTTAEKALAVMKNTAEVFKKADFSIINLENIFGKKEDYTPIIKTGPNLISDESFISFIDVLKPTAVGFANNHTYDYGYEAFRHTADILAEKGYLYAGAGKNISEAYKPVEFSDADTHATVFCVCENEFGIADAETPGAAGYCLGKITKAVFSAKDRGFLPIIFFHGGNEHNPFPSPAKIELYRHFVDIGAKAVIAMHTHCPQGYEVYNGAPIVYSMGNFFFPQKDPIVKSWNYGYMTELYITAEETDINIVPYKFDFDCHTLLEGKEKERFLNYISLISADFDDEQKINKYFDAWVRISGLYGYINYAKFTPEMLSCDKEMIKEFKNLFSCEAHNELISKTAKLIYDNRLEEAKEYEPFIRSLQDMKF